MLYFAYSAVIFDRQFCLRSGVVSKLRKFNILSIFYNLLSRMIFVISFRLNFLHGAR